MRQKATLRLNASDNRCGFVTLPKYMKEDVSFKGCLLRADTHLGCDGVDPQ